jgi:hypothetical protein
MDGGTMTVKVFPNQRPVQGQLAGDIDETENNIDCIDIELSRRRVFAQTVGVNGSNFQEER